LLQRKRILLRIRNKRVIQDGNQPLAIARLDCGSQACAICSLVKSGPFSLKLKAGGAGAVPIYRLFQGQAFEPEQVAMLAQVFEEVLPLLGLADREDLMTTRVAQKIIELAQTGVRDPVRLKALIVDAFKKD
jgi:hypothetical protein